MGSGGRPVSVVDRLGMFDAGPVTSRLFQVCPGSWEQGMRRRMTDRPASSIVSIGDSIASCISLGWRGGGVREARHFGVGTFVRIQSPRQTSQEEVPTMKGCAELHPSPERDGRGVLILHHLQTSYSKTLAPLQSNIPRTSAPFPSETLAESSSGEIIVVTAALYASSRVC
jgi:hypothetical protein